MTTLPDDLVLSWNSPTPKEPNLVSIALSDDACPLPHAACEVTLHDGTTRDLSALEPNQLTALQWEQERAFARRILDAPKGSGQRADAIGRAYDTVTAIVGARQAAASFRDDDEPVVMGMNRRYEQLVAKLLSGWRAQGVSPRFFEIGYGSGAFLHRIHQQGYEVAGIEVSAAMRKQACRLFGPGHEDNLLLGDVLGWEPAADRPRYHVAYWNDVFEHIPPDEIADCLRKIHDLLVPGGQLVTFTPNWHMRPWDITGDVCPPRTEAAGLHLKEYTLREVNRLLRETGFRHVATPLFVTRRRCVMLGNGLAGVKRLFEPRLERLPFPVAKLLCRGLGLSCTVARKIAN